METIASSQQIPAEPLAEILAALTRARYLRTTKDGYRLARPADKIFAAEIIRLFDGALAPLEPISEKGYNFAPMEKDGEVGQPFQPDPGTDFKPTGEHNPG